MHLARTALGSLLLALAAATAGAAGLNLRWTQCYGDGGLTNANFACNTNAGARGLVGSFEVDQDLLAMTGVEFSVDLTTAAAILPSWWQFKNAGACRQLALSIAAVDGNNCFDWALGMASMNIAAYNVGTLGPNTARILGINAVPLSGAADILAHAEYTVFRLSISNLKTVGTGACDGCLVPACLGFTRLVIYYNGDFSTTLTLTEPAHETNSHYVYWQGGGGVEPLPIPGDVCGDSAGFSITTSVLGRGQVARSPFRSKYRSGTPVSLYAQPLPGARFVAWSGDTTATEDTLDIVVPDHALSYVASFERDPAASPAITGAPDAPGDQGSQVRIQWNRSPVDDGALPGLLCCYEIQRRPGEPPSAPWGAVVETPATTSQTYDVPAPTPADSTAADPALFRFRVVAKAAGDTAQWLSNEVEAHSVDNLAPPGPDFVTGSIASGLASFFWPAVSVPDFSHYSIYRGVEEPPPTDLAHRIGTTTLTGFSDQPGHFAYYVVTAYDVHGNQGVGTEFVPNHAADVQDRPAPAAFTVGQPTPSPAVRLASLTFGVPRATNARIDVYDAQGRALRRITEGERPPGWHTVQWDARDSRGQLLPAGVYFLSVKTSLGSAIRRVALLP